jgi:hypothetical protein
MTQTIPVEREQPTLTLEEEILSQAGLLDLEDDNGNFLDGEEKTSALVVAREELQELPGRVSKMDFTGHQVWNVGQDLPINKSLKIAFMFATQREDLAVAYCLGDVRAYAEPKQSLPGDSFTRITINRASPAVLHEPLTRDAYAAAVAAEIEHLLSLEEEEGTECETCGAENPLENICCGQCGAKLPDDEPEDPATAPS